MSWCVILHIMAKETHLEAKNSFVILPAGMANQFPAFLSSILFVYHFFLSYVSSLWFPLLLFCVSFCLLFFVCYFSGWYGKLVSCLPVKYFVCLNNFFVICFFFVISSSSFLCFVLFVVSCLLFFRLVWKTSFLSSRRITVNLPALTHRYLPTLPFWKSNGKKQSFFSSAHKQHFT